MIISLRCKETKKVWEGRRSKKLPNEIQDRSLRKLRQLDASICLDDLKNPPGNNLESLGGNREGEMSIRINKQWRICFIWTDKGAILVEITDYH